MSRNKNIDVFRSCALLLVMIYHCWVLMGSRKLGISIINNFVVLGGEIGVTAFFAISGFGIYLSLDTAYKNGTFNYISFLKRRFFRIAPQYYLSILIVVLISDAQYFSGYGIKMLITHLFFVHNLFPDCSGTINGALWTMGITVQFYIVAPILYKFFKKWNHLSFLCSILITTSCKIFLFSIVLPYLGKNGHLEFFAGRQLFSALDNFCVGLYVASLIKNLKNKIGHKQAITITGIFIILLIGISNMGIRYGVNTNNWSGYIWHSCCATILGGIMLGISYLKTHETVYFYKKLIQLSHYEYGIYIWHLIIIRNFIDHSPWIQTCLNRPHIEWLYFLLIATSIAVGVIFTKLLARSSIKTAT